MASWKVNFTSLTYSSMPADLWVFPHWRNGNCPTGCWVMSVFMWWTREMNTSSWQRLSDHVRILDMAFPGADRVSERNRWRNTIFTIPSNLSPSTVCCLPTSCEFVVEIKLWWPNAIAEDELKVMRDDFDNLCAIFKILWTFSVCLTVWNVWFDISGGIHVANEDLVYDNADFF